MPVEYPRHVHKYGGEYLIVRSESEHADALGSGWCDVPPQTPPDEVAIAEDEAVIAEPSPDETPTVAIPPKRKPGRPKKGTE
jgi:hypothetical protein